MNRVIFDLQRFVEIKNIYSNTLLSGGDSNDSIENGGYWNSYWHTGGNNVTINGGAGDDSIYNSGSQVTINGGDGNDTLDSYGYSSVTIDGGAGNDSISNIGDEVSINGGADDDYIYNDSFHVTINGGTGNDTVSLDSNGNLIQYTAGDGNDTIFGFNESDTLTITGSSYSTQTSGDDVIVTVGDGKLLLKDAKGKNFNINKTDTTNLITLTERDNFLRNNFTNVMINALGGNDTIWNLTDSNNVTINGGAGNDGIW